MKKKGIYKLIVRTVNKYGDYYKTVYDIYNSSGRKVDRFDFKDQAEKRLRELNGELFTKDFMEYLK